MKIDGLYIHIPFCAQICSYCDFVKFTPDAWIAKYPEWVEKELHTLLRTDLDFSLKTLYIGGGTPTIQNGACLDEILQRLSSDLELSDLEEFTVEINPETLSHALLQKLLSFGVTRVSVGLQSSFTGTLFNLGRQYPRPDIHKLKALKDTPFSLNVDLIYAVPGLTQHVLEQTLCDFLHHHPQHISTYELTLYSNHGSYPYLPSEDERISQYGLIESTLNGAGLSRYEVSNFAKPNEASKHNLLYWDFQNILGLGVSAHSSLNHKNAHSPLSNQNWTNPKTLPAYQHMLEEGQHPYLTTPKHSTLETEKLFLIAQLRKTTGLDRRAYQLAFHKDFLETYAQRLPPLIEQGHLEVTETAIRPTPSGHLLLDSLLKELL